MVESYTILSWFGSFLLWLLLFRLLDRWQQSKGRSLNVWSKLLLVIVCFHINLILSLLLYSLVVNLFHISIEGFMNFNGIFTLFALWFITACVILFFAKKFAELLSRYYKIIRGTFVVLMILPLLIMLILVVAISAK